MRNDGPTPAGLQFVPVDGRDTPQPESPSISHESKNDGVATSEPQDIFHERPKPPPSKGPARGTPQPTRVQDDPPPLQVVPQKPVDTRGMVRIPRGEFKMGSPKT